MKKFDIKGAIDAQAAYCEKEGVPRFAPYNGRCYRCGRYIYGEDGINLESAKTKHVTGCPHCRTSYCN